jgi:hypothetical protein
VIPADVGRAIEQMGADYAVAELARRGLLRSEGKADDEPTEPQPKKRRVTKTVEFIRDPQSGKVTGAIVEEEV